MSKLKPLFPSVRVTIKYKPGDVVLCLKWGQCEVMRISQDWHEEIEPYYIVKETKSNTRVSGDFAQRWLEPYAGQEVRQ